MLKIIGDLRSGAGPMDVLTAGRQAPTLPVPTTCALRLREMSTAFYRFLLNRRLTQLNWGHLAHERAWINDGHVARLRMWS